MAVSVPHILVSRRTRDTQPGTTEADRIRTDCSARLPRRRRDPCETDSAVNEGKAGGLIVELSWLRTAMLRFLITFAAAITAGLLALGALRIAVLAFGTPAAHVPPLRLLTYGGIFTALTALIFVPAYVA